MSRRGPGAPLTNRGLTNLNKADPTTPALPDFLRFTVQQAHLGLDQEFRQQLDAVQFVHTLAPESGISVDVERKGGRRGYAFHFLLLTPDGACCGDISFGGERQMGTVSVELTGAGCARIAASRPFAEAWGHVRCLLETVGAKITRLDIAHDDYEGVHDLDAAVSMYDGGEFDGAFARPALKWDGWNDGSGKTIYIGKQTATRQLVIYEKGRQQGLRDGDAGVEWVRWEARFNNRCREVPLDALVAPWEYMVGQYPALSWISSCMTVIRVAVERSKANLVSSIRHCKRQFGSLLGLVARNQMDDETIGRFVRLKLARASLPGWLNQNPLGRASLGRAFASSMMAV